VTLPLYLMDPTVLSRSTKLQILCKVVPAWAVSNQAIPVHNAHTYVTVVMAGIVPSQDLLHMLLCGLQQLHVVQCHCYC
jgi:hypothetical protein